MNNTFENRDCMEGMKEYPDNHFDLAICDPEYGINVNHNIGRRRGDLKSNYKKVTWDTKPPEQIYFNELFRVSKNQIIWGANHFVDLISRRSPCWVVWDKLFSVDVSFASVELAYTSFESVTKRIALSSQRKNGIHPTQKPVPLYLWLLKNYAKPGDLILDTHVGSASSLIACEKLGFSYVGYELDVDYYKAACGRLNEFRQQIDMFIDVSIHAPTIEQERLNL